MVQMRFGGVDEELKRKAHKSSRLLARTQRAIFTGRRTGHMTIFLYMDPYEKTTLNLIGEFSPGGAVSIARISFRLRALLRVSLALFRLGLGDEI